MRIIGLTGGSGAGKGEVAKMFATLGAGTVDADDVYRGLLQTDASLLGALRSAFGDVLLPDGTLNRPALAKIVFSDPQKLTQLNEITSPYIKAGSQAAFAAIKDVPIIIYDAPTLFQSGANRLCDRVICVLADRNVRVNRIMHRDGISEQAACARIDAQPTDAFYRGKSDYIIQNNGDLDATQRQVDALWRELSSFNLSNKKYY